MESLLHVKWFIYFICMKTGRFIYAERRLANFKDNQRNELSIRDINYLRVRAKIAASTVVEMLQPSQLKASLLE